MKNLTVKEVEYITFRLARKHLAFDEPIPDFTSRFPNILESCLIVTEQADGNAYLSARNIPGVEQTYVDSLGALDVISHKKLLLTKAALETLEKKLS